MASPVTDAPALEAQVEMQQFLYHEARLLQDMRFAEWLELFAEDATYRIPVRELARFHGRADPLQTIVEGELTFDFVNEGKPELETRVRRLLSGLAHIEEPQPVTTRLITNVEAVPQPDSSVLVYSNFHVLRVKEQRAPDQFFGSRTDRLRRVGDRWRFASRVVIFGVRILENPVSLLF